MPELVSAPVRVPVPGGKQIDEVMLVLAGAVHAEYVAVCLPAFAPDTVHREG